MENHKMKTKSVPDKFKVWYLEENSTLKEPETRYIKNYKKLLNDITDAESPEILSEVKKIY